MSAQPAPQIPEFPGYVQLTERVVSLSEFNKIFGLDFGWNEAPVGLNKPEMPGGVTLLRILVLQNPDTGHKLLSIGVEGYNSVKARLDGTAPPYSSFVFFPTM